ncbi:hypothetical protein QV65_32450 [Rhodococcus erythropolis]|nr:hypothetical protein QV65_32450 [Rhodococcus erythropolis]
MEPRRRSRWFHLRSRRGKFLGHRWIDEHGADPRRHRDVGSAGDRCCRLDRCRYRRTRHSCRPRTRRPAHRAVRCRRGLHRCRCRSGFRRRGRRGVREGSGVRSAVARPGAAQSPGRSQGRDSGTRRRHPCTQGRAGAARRSQHHPARRRDRRAGRSVGVGAGPRDARNLKPGTDRLDQDIAINRVAEAEQRLLEVQERNQDLTVKADDANRVGIEGSNQVVAAKDRVYDAERRVTDAQQQVRVAQEATEESMTKASSAADKYEQALSKLSPAAADFVRSMRALAEEGGAWNVFQQSVQQGLFEGIGDSVSDLANTVLPKITPAMTEIARSIGGIVTTISDVLTGPAGEQLVTLLTEIPQFFTAMTPGIESTVQGFLAFGDAAAPAMTALGQGVGDVLGMIGDAFVELNDSGVLTEAISGFGDMLSGIGQWMGPLTKMFVELGAVAGPIFGDLFTIWGQTIEEMTPALTIMAQVIGDVLVNDFEAFRPTIVAVTQAFADFLVAVSPLIQPLAEMAAIILTGMATNFSTLMVAMTPVIQQIADNLTPIIPILANHMAKMTPIFADAAMILGDALVTALDELGPYLPSWCRRCRIW